MVLNEESFGKKSRIEEELFEYEYEDAFIERCVYRKCFFNKER